MTTGDYVIALHTAFCNTDFKLQAQARHGRHPVCEKNLNVIINYWDVEDFHISAGEGDQGTKLVSGRNLLENAEHKHRGQGFYVVNRNEPKLFKKKKIGADIHGFTVLCQSEGC